MGAITIVSKEDGESLQGPLTLSGQAPGLTLGQLMLQMPLRSS